MLSAKPIASHRMKTKILFFYCMWKRFSVAKYIIGKPESSAVSLFTCFLRYAGYRPQFKYQCSETFGNATHRLLTSDSVRKSNDSVLRPIDPPRSQTVPLGFHDVPKVSFLQLYNKRINNIVGLTDCLVAQIYNVIDSIALFPCCRNVGLGQRFSTSSYFLRLY